jgi:hypothetical protein
MSGIGRETAQVIRIAECPDDSTNDRLGASRIACAGRMVATPLRRLS